MTKEQALQNLSLPADADMETVRMRFAARYTLSDAQYDHTLTDGMKAVHEQHLRELEQAYKVITDNPVIDDMGALLSLGKGYVEEDGDTIRTDSVIPSDEALAFFALYPHDSPVLAEQRYTQYVSELEVAIEQVGLEASKEPYRKEIAHAEACLNVVINYLLASQMLAFQQEEAIEVAEQQESIPEPEWDKMDRPIDAVPAASRPFNKRIYGLIAIVAMMLLAIGVWIGKRSGADKDDKPNPEMQALTEAETTRAHMPNTQSSAAAPEVAKPSVPVAHEVDEARLDQQLDPSPTTIVASLLEQYISGYKVTVSDGLILLEGNQTYRLPIRNIDHINDEGAFVSVFGSSLYVDNQPKRTSEGLQLTRVSREDRDRLLKAIRRIAPARKAAEKTIASPSTKPTTETADPVSSTGEHTAGPASSKPTTDKNNSTRQDNTEQKKSPDTKPTEKTTPSENEIAKS
ncbi:hypothetical protein H8B06_13870 [Sphingobacterium sp. DN00404]|uniref:DUF4115 domain-containing protein n=1 Tax=Sphingobacterium micropteri TaxID=2763501 RepID=A0ABR7YRV1_9SPHI|nr:hypothetical protein [Sphingobacterium micropteri]MBD1433921.1 hypothetical protein [Sphingobacterium micropteri]